jgi:hypothetical protein
MHYSIQDMIGLFAILTALCAYCGFAFYFCSKEDTKDDFAKKVIKDGVRYFSYEKGFETYYLEVKVLPKTSLHVDENEVEKL